MWKNDYGNTFAERTTADIGTFWYGPTSSLNRRDSSRNVHAFHHFAKHRVAKVALTVVQEGVISHVEEELAGGAVFISAVRAMEMVPRLFSRPLSASFLMGGLGCFCCICSLKPATLNHKAGITRWNVVLL